MICSSINLILKVEAKQSSKWIWTNLTRTTKKFFISKARSSKKCIKISQTFSCWTKTIFSTKIAYPTRPVSKIGIPRLAKLTINFKDKGIQQQAKIQTASFYFKNNSIINPKAIKANNKPIWKFKQHLIRDLYHCNTREMHPKVFRKELIL